MVVKKRILFVVLMLFLFVFCKSVFAHLGMTPAKIPVDFEPGLKFFVNFDTFASSPHGMEVYASGDFAEYVTFDRTILGGDESSFTAYIELPQEAEKPGRNNLYIRVRESLPEGEEGEGIVTRLEVGALIQIKVPYPGKYAEIKSFEITDVNEGEPVSFYVEVESLGYEDIYAKTSVEVYADDKLIDNHDLSVKFLKTRDVKNFNKTVEGGYYKAGFYNATAVVDFGERIIKSNETFRVGTLFVDIVNWSIIFNNTKITKFFIEIESRWNNDIVNVFAEVNVTKDEESVDFFKTPSIRLKRWQRATLEGFFNAEDLEAGKYKANITVFYEGEATTKIVDIKLVQPLWRISKTVILIVVIIGAVILVIALMSVIVYFLLKRSLKNMSRK